MNHKINKISVLMAILVLNSCSSEDANDKEVIRSLDTIASEVSSAFQKELLAGKKIDNCIEQLFLFEYQFQREIRDINIHDRVSYISITQNFNENPFMVLACYLSIQENENIDNRLLLQVFNEIPSLGVFWQEACSKILAKNILKEEDLYDFFLNESLESNPLNIMIIGHINHYDRLLEGYREAIGTEGFSEIKILLIISRLYDLCVLNSYDMNKLSVEVLPFIKFICEDGEASSYYGGLAQKLLKIFQENR